MFDVAYALGAPAEGGSQGGIMAFLPLLIIFLIFYFLLILPQQRKMKKHRDFLNNLEKEKTVMTTSGIYGKITGITETVVTLEIAPQVKIKIARDQIAAYSEPK
ncbi:MAG TPA: preprotein translocase subunit YajC [Thermodesulfobacteriota bacterium]|nr:preprotein translocase subunit YajC [Deltaproteobacteria bacterium]HNU70955.1 preprotein translocase subunit YajC [Thermodesulfobacteriota bacterium]